MTDLQRRYEDKLFEFKRARRISRHPGFSKQLRKDAREAAERIRPVVLAMQTLIEQRSL